MQKVTEYLQTEPYVRLVALDFSRAFDTVRTSSLFSKLANSELPDNIYNWLLQFFTNRTHSTNFNGFTSPSLHINSSIVQGSGMGPATYAVNSSDLHPKNVQVTIFKYADDVFPIIPASLDCVTANEIENIAGWASRNNLRLNEAKSREIIFRKKGVTISPPPPRCGNISRHSQIDILGVIVTETLSVAPHVARVEARCSQALYAIKTLRAHGLGGLALHNVCRLLLESRLLYAAPSWIGFATVEDKVRLQKVLARAKRWGLDGGKALPRVEDLLHSADTTLFKKVLNNPQHVMHQFLPALKNHQHLTRPRTHNFVLPSASTLDKKNFMTRMLYKDIY